MNISRPSSVIPINKNYIEKRRITPRTALVNWILDNSIFGVIVLNVDLNVVLHNAKSEHILSDSMVEIRGSELIVDPRIASRFRKNADMAFRGAPSKPMLLTDADGELSVSLIFQARNLDVPTSEETITLWVSDLGAGGPDCTWLARAFDLTPAEHIVVERLAGGEAPAQIATALGNSVATVRSHLLRIYSKTGVTNQTKLVRLAHQIPFSELIS